MKAEYVLKSITNNTIEDLIQACKEEIAVCNYSGSAKSLFNARLKLSKSAYSFQLTSKRGEKPVTFSRPKLAGAYVIDGVQMICNGYYGVMYNEAYDGLINVEECEDLFDMRKLFADMHKEDMSVVAINIDIIKADYKIYKITHKLSKECAPLVKIHNTFVNVEYLISVIETLDNVEIYVAEDNYKSLLIEASNGRAIICPYNPKRVNDMQVVAQY